MSVLVNPQKKEKKKGKLLVSSDKSSSGREFREGDRVTVFDSNDKQCVGTVKWALPGKENGLDGYIIGIELVRKIALTIALFIMLLFLLKG